MAAQYAAAAVSFGGTLLAAWLAGAQAYGRASIAIAFPALVWSLLGVKSGAVTTRYFAQAEASGDLRTTSAMFRLGLGLEAGLALLSFAIVLSCAVLFDEAPLTVPDGTLPMAVLFAASIPFSSLSNTSIAYLSVSRRFRTIASLQLAEKLISVALIALLVPAGLDAVGIVVALGSGQAAAGLLAAVSAIRLMRGQGVSLREGRLSAIRDYRRELRSAFAWSYVASTTGGVLSNVPLLVMGWQGSIVGAGYCRLALSIMNVCSYLEAALCRAVYPRFAAATRGMTIPDLAKLTLHTGLPAGLALLAAAAAVPHVVALTLGSEFGPMAPGAAIMVAAVALVTCVFWVQPYLQARGLFRAWGAGSAVAAAIVALLAWPMIGSWGYLGAAVVVALGRVAPYVIGLALTVRVMRASPSLFRDDPR